jgi:hypothetical protein
VRTEVSRANAVAATRIIESEPWLTDILPAKERLPASRAGTLLHAGPPLEPSNFVDPARFAIAGAQVYEGWADDVAQGERRLDRGEVTVASAHDNDAIAPMAGIISPSMPLFVVANKRYGNTVYTNVNEGVGKVKTLRFGAFDSDVLARLNWMADVLAPSLRDAIRVAGGINLKQIVEEAIRRGDECHNRNKSASMIIFQKLATSLVKAGYSGKPLLQILEFIGGNEHFFLNLSMAAAKASLDSAHGVRGSSVVTAMSANGKDFAIRVSGLGRSRPPYSWHRASVPSVRGRYLSPYTAADACPILGDSFIMECNGLGAFSMAAAPAITEYVGGTIKWATGVTKRMYSITTMKHGYYKIPYLGYLGVPTGIDVGKVLRHRIAPIMNVGIAHKRAGIGQIGAGLFRAPLGCFGVAASAYKSAYGVTP